MSTAQQLQKALEERAKEIQQLQNKLQRAEAEKQRWDVQRRALESKLPTDVQALQRQKRELQQQLQREESEKMELFKQINKLIGDLADMQTKAAEGPDLTDVNAQLELQLQRLSAENAQLRGNADVAAQKLKFELEQKQSDIERLSKTHQLEVGRFTQQLRDYQTQLDSKTTALESLKSAIPSSRENELEIEVRQLKAELNQKTQATNVLESQRNELQQLKERHDKEMNELKAKLNETIEKSQQADSTRQELAEVFEHLGVPSTSNLSMLKRRITALKTDATEEADRRRKMDIELDTLRQTLNASNAARQEISRQLQELAEKNEELQHAESLKEELHTLMESLRASKSEVAAKEIEVSEWRRRAIKHEEERDRLMSDLQNTRSALETAEQSLVARTVAPDSHELLQRLENELREARKIADKEREIARAAQQQKELFEEELRVLAERATIAENQVADFEARERMHKEKEAEYRAAADQRRLEDLRRLREEHKIETERLRSEFTAEIEVLKGRANNANSDLRRAKGEIEQERNSTVEMEGELRRQLKELNEELETVRRQRAELTQQKDSERRDAEVRLTNEINRLRQRESQLNDELQHTRESVNKLREQITQLESKAAIGDTTAADDRQRLQSDVSELSQMNDELRETVATLQKRHDEEMRNMRDELIENVRRLSDLLEAESKRFQSASNERDLWMSEAQQLEKKIEDLQSQVRTQLPTINGSGDAELRAKVIELTGENANSNGNPTPKPRKLNGFNLSPSNETSETSSADESTPKTKSAPEDSSKMQAELDKQKRLINSLPELSKMAALLPNISESLSYADVPIAITAIIGSHMQIPLEEIAAEYAKDALQRKSIVINTFRKDIVTETFLNSYQSKFMLQGYAGEELLAVR
ncbi:hypothetical protein M3Y98_00188600 [Aphelenchoides besseyi]|nr:hypothetical protein M3Y98_00188600 [Aphelenchoides besseyi]